MSGGLPGFQNVTVLRSSVPERPLMGGGVWSGLPFNCGGGEGCVCLGELISEKAKRERKTCEFGKLWPTANVLCFEIFLIGM